MTMNVGPYYPQDSSYYRTNDQLLQDFVEYWRENIDDPTWVPATRRELCPTCDGGGTIVNRSIDGQGLSPDDPELDQDFWDGYVSGRYDVVCDECHGRNVVDVLDEDKLAPEALEAWCGWQQDMRDAVAEQLAELRMGA